MRMEKFNLIEHCKNIMNKYFYLTVTDVTEIWELMSTNYFTVEVVNKSSLIIIISLQKFL